MSGNKSEYTLTILCKHAWHVGSIAALADCIMDGNILFGFENDLQHVLDALMMDAVDEDRIWDKERFRKIAEQLRHAADNIDQASSDVTELHQK